MEKPDNNLKDGTVDGEMLLMPTEMVISAKIGRQQPSHLSSAEEVCDGFDNDCDAGR